MEKNTRNKRFIIVYVWLNKGPTTPAPQAPDSPEHHTHEVTLGIIFIVYANSALEWPF